MNLNNNPGRFVREEIFHTTVKVIIFQIIIPLRLGWWRNRVLGVGAGAATIGLLDLDRFGWRWLTGESATAESTSCRFRTWGATTGWRCRIPDACGCITKLPEGNSSEDKEGAPDRNFRSRGTPVEGSPGFGYGIAAGKCKTISQAQICILGKLPNILQNV